MYLYLLKQTALTDYETYDSCVIAAMNKQDALVISLSLGSNRDYTDRYDSWPSRDRFDLINVTLLGQSVAGIQSGIICSSFKEQGF